MFSTPLQPIEIGYIMTTIASMIIFIFVKKFLR